MKKSILLVLAVLLGFSVSAQQGRDFTMEGTVYDSADKPLSGASVYVKDRVGIGTMTDDNGTFRIKAEYGNTIVFSFAGYDSYEYLVTEEKKNLQIRLSASTQQIDEIVVVGMGSQRKISSVAAVSSIDASELQIPSASMSNLLGGKVPGVISMQTSGEPGKNIAEFWVRGIGTFGASSGALILVDGLEGDLNSIDPADVESFSVLKDASATAVYGVRGANGVVLVTTKKGESGRLQITGRANFTLSHLRKVPTYLRAYDYAKLANEASVVRGDLPLYTDIDLDMIKDRMDPDMYPDVSWQDEILNRVSFKHTYYASARGGGDVARYFMSLGTSSETAAYKVDKDSPYSSNVGYNTYNYRLNLDINLTKTTSLYLGTDGYLSNLKQPGMADTDYIWEAQSQINPLALPTKYSNGMLPAAGSGGASSPYVLINRTGTNAEQAYKGKMTLAIHQDLKFLLDGLKFKIQGAYDIHSFFEETRYVHPALYQASGRNNLGELVMQEKVEEQSALYFKNTNQYRKYHLETTLSYDRLFGQDHRVSGLIYYYLSDEKATKKATTSLNAIPIRYQGVSSRLTYGFRDTYLIDVNFGYTGSENFEPGKQYGFFPSVAVGWVLTGYQAVRDRLPWLDLFKIRGSYGSVGNDRIDDSARFLYLTKVSVGSGSPWGSSSVETINETRVGADNLQWEKAIKFDVGVEGNLFRNRLEFVVDYFQDQRDGIFQSRVQVPDYVGVVTMPYGNVGKMKSYGADGNVSYIQRINNNLSVTVRGNFTYSKNKVQNWEQAYLEYPYLEYSGYPYQSLRGYQALGLFKDENDVKYSPIQTFGSYEPGDIKYKDINGDGMINELDKVPLTYKTYPLLMYGFGLEVQYKSFTFGVLFKGTGKTDYFHVGQSVTLPNDNSVINGMGYVPFYDGNMGNVLSLANDPKNRWIPLDYALANGIDPNLAENPNALFPRLQYGKNANNSQLSTFWKDDARYLRLQEITLNYNLKNRALRRAGIGSIDFQFVGSNLAAWSPSKLFDPEQAQYNGVVYPIPATYTLQIYINL